MAGPDRPAGRNPIEAHGDRRAARVAAIRARHAWLAVEGIFRRVSDQATITPEQIEELIQRALAELAWKHEIVLAQDGRFFDGSGNPPKDVDALILESHAEEFREALALNDLKPVADVGLPLLRGHERATWLTPHWSN
jgi:hypothetical protein